MNSPKPIEKVGHRHLIQIEKFLDRFWLDRARRFSRPSFSIEMAKYQISTGGKRLRALLPLFIFEVFDLDPSLAIPLGAAVEVIHNATLIHDDLQDGDRLRRGQPTVWTKFSMPQAINGGDAMFFFALEILESLSLDRATKGLVMAQTIESTLDVIEGQAQEFLMKSESFPHVQRYLDVISGKTSGLFKLPILSALQIVQALKRADRQIVSIADPLMSQVNWTETMKAAEVAADQAGQLFQIHDDYLDLYGDKKRDQVATDIAEGKVSYLVAFVNEFGEEKEKIELDNILRTPREETTREMINRGLEIFETSGAKQAAEKFMAKLKSGLLESQELKENSSLREIFEGLLASMKI